MIATLAHTAHEAGASLTQAFLLGAVGLMLTVALAMVVHEIWFR